MPDARALALANEELKAIEKETADYEKNSKKTEAVCASIIQTVATVPDPITQAADNEWKAKRQVPAVRSANSTEHFVRLQLTAVASAVESLRAAEIGRRVYCAEEAGRQLNQLLL
eukprot:CAMPEP_0175094654 /NCGR_PEP_ID=MMETSP0086_2-20121207/3713_1 /TAXON_ID=136419 /ORGANISM="Unknown Unknown, Strain D1" /LENGTH=114 /DNA_ID=CAMNT_0016367801 /DNA_START=7 /DNA_END=352 /DNA_ORIENTATION=+